MMSSRESSLSSENMKLVFLGDDCFCSCNIPPFFGRRSSSLSVSYGLEPFFEASKLPLGLIGDRLVDAKFLLSTKLSNALSDSGELLSFFVVARDENMVFIFACFAGILRISFISESSLSEDDSFFTVLPL